jgi:hypothetical protein
MPTKNKQTLWPESAGELYRLRGERRLSAMLVLTFADRGVLRSQRGVSPTAVISDFYTGAAIFLPSSSSIVPTRLSGPSSAPTNSQIPIQTEKEKQAYTFGSSEIPTFVEIIIMLHN